MQFYLDPSFFVLLAVAVAGAAMLGLSERSLRPYALVISCAFLALLFCKDVGAALACALFCVLALVATYVLMAKPGSRLRFWVGLALVLLPIVTYKVTLAAGLHASLADLLPAGAGGAAQGAGVRGATAAVPSDGADGAGVLGFMGISYVTFRAVQVLVEVHDGLIRRMGVADYLLFLLFFPTFTSGPIDRSRRFVEDVRSVKSREEYAGLLGRGILLLLLGMTYSMVFAPVCHQWYSPQAWGSQPVAQQLLSQLRCACAYALYLFFDFAGAGYMAMGAGYCLGVRVPRNFHAPFIACDLKDFWNRWNITLSFWLRDFVFMRFSRTAMRRHWFSDNLRVAQVGLVTNMLVMGFWHGIAPGYIVYGLYHGLLLALTETFQKRSAFYKRHHRSIWFRVASWFVTMQLVLFGLAIFSGQLAVMLRLS